MTSKYVIYHANCNDGLSAAALHKILTGGKDTTYLPGYYHKKDYPDFTGAEVTFLDFSFKEKELIEVLEVADKVLIIDHHISAYEYINPIHESRKYKSFTNYIYNVRECGTSLTWLYYSKVCTPMPTAVQCVRDQDIYTWTNPKLSKPFCIYMETLDKHSDGALERYIEFWRSILLENPYSISKSIIDTGNSLLKFKEIQTESIWKTKLEIEYLNQKFYAINTPYIFVNNLYDIMAKEAKVDYLLTYSFSGDGVHFSLRSNKGFDTLPYTLSLSANGGGHSNASGAYMDYSTFWSHPISSTLLLQPRQYNA